MSVSFLFFLRAEPPGILNQMLIITRRTGLDRPVMFLCFGSSARHPRTEANLVDPYSSQQHSSKRGGNTREIRRLIAPRRLIRSDISNAIMAAKEYICICERVKAGTAASGDETVRDLKLFDKHGRLGKRNRNMPWAQTSTPNIYNRKKKYENRERSTAVSNQCA
jgi:hypothetical protein